MGSSSTGSKWIMLLLIYFLLMTIIVTAVRSFQGGEIDTEFNILNSYCDAPRELYTPYSDEYDETFSKYDINDLSHLSCSRSKGVISEQSCLSISGCIWESPSLTWLQRLFGTTTPDPTCIGTINASNYNIDTYTTTFGGTKVKKHNNTDGFTLNYGSICNHPNVIDDQDLCDLFSCSWYETKLIDTDFGINPTSGGKTILRQGWDTIKSLFTLREDFGMTNPFGAYLISLFIFWLPLVALVFAFVQIILQSTWT